MAFLQQLRSIGTIKSFGTYCCCIMLTEKKLHSCSKRLEVGQTVVSGSDAAPEVGNHLPPEYSIGTIVHNIELRPGQGANFGSLGWCFCAVNFTRRNMRIRMPSGESS